MFIKIDCLPKGAKIDASMSKFEHQFRNDMVGMPIYPPETVQSIIAAIKDTSKTLISTANKPEHETDVVYTQISYTTHDPLPDVYLQLQNAIAAIRYTGLNHTVRYITIPRYETYASICIFASKLPL